MTCASVPVPGARTSTGDAAPSDPVSSRGVAGRVTSPRESIRDFLIRHSREGAGSPQRLITAVTRVRFAPRPSGAAPTAPETQLAHDRREGS